jgi:hypothetical protein
LGQMGRGIFSLEGLDRANHVDPVQEISVFTRPPVPESYGEI